MKVIKKVILMLLACLISVPLCAPAMTSSAVEGKYINIWNDGISGKRIVTGIGFGTTAGEIKNQIAGGCVVEIKSPAGQTVTDPEIVGTGYDLIVKTTIGAVLDDAKTVVFGDFDSDGKATSADLSNLRKYALGVTDLSEEYKTAAGITTEGGSNSSGSVSVSISMLSMTQQLIGVATIEQHYSSEIPEYINRTTVNSLETILSDMQDPHEGFPHGVSESVDWSRQPRVGMGNNPGSYRAMTAWGMLYEDLQGNPAANTRVQVRNMRAYYLSKSRNKWIQLQSSTTVDGGAFVENSAENVSIKPNIRDETNNGGGVSATAGHGYNFHFWPSTGRASIPPSDIAAMFTTVQARLILNNPAGVDDRSTARYILCMGGDYWLSLSSGWENFKTNGDFAIGRFKYVKNDWQAFNCWTGDAATIRSNPPPME